MVEKTNIEYKTENIPLNIVKKQRSHNLFVFCNTEPNQEEIFFDWFTNECSSLVLKLDRVLSVQHFKQHEKDISNGHAKPIGYFYLGVYELCLDGAEESGVLIDQINAIYKLNNTVSEPVTWLYYPVSEKVGRPAKKPPQLMTLAFANPVKGSEATFREWYSTQHIRHALNVLTLVSGQRFELTEFQKYGAEEPKYESIALYEQEGVIEDMAKGFELLKPGTLNFSPSLDIERFTEWVYYPVTECFSNKRME